MVDYRLLKILKVLLTQSDIEFVETDDIKTLLSVAKLHSSLQCVAYYFTNAPKEHKPEPEIMKKLQQILFQSADLSTQQIYAVNEMQEAFEKNQVYNLAVKGIRTKMRYPDEVLRSMGDIDILYKVEQHNQVRKIMTDLKYDGFEEGRKNDTYSRKPHIYVEAHRQLVSSESQFIEYLESVWDRAIPCESCQYTYEMTLEDEYIYNIIHLVEHFKRGGIGVRFIMDIWVYEQLQMNREYLKNELSRLGIYEFYLNIKALAEYWFGDGKTNELLDQLGEYIFSSGVFGNRGNISALEVQDGKLKALFKACFPNLKAMSSMFSWLEKYPFLLPFAWIIRFFRGLTRRRQNVRLQLKNIKNGDIEKAVEIKTFYQQYGLK